MSADNPTIREDLNNGPGPFRIADNHRALCFGDLVGLMIGDMANTETGVAPAADVATLANQPSCMLDMVATAGTFTGRLALKIGDASVVPQSGEGVWNGGLTVRLNPGDAITTVDFKYTQATDTASILDRILGQRDD
jgi:hypothetical protein